MIGFEVEARRTKATGTQDAQNRYLLLADFGGRVTEPLTVDRDNIDSVLNRLEVKLAGLRLREIEDFHPDRLYARMDEFRDLDQAAPEEPEPKPEAPKADLEQILRKGSILEQITEGGDPFQQYVRELARAHAAPQKRDDTARHAALGERMRALLHHPRFQALEATWRGLDYVIRNSDEEVSKIHVVQYSRQDLERDLGAAADLRATLAFKLFTSRAWKGVFGLFSFGSAARDIELLGRVALLAGHARVAFVAEGSVDMGDHWKELRSIPEAKYLGLALPRILLRLPYGAKAGAVESFRFEEMPEKPVHAHYLWGNPALAVLAIAARGGIQRDELDLDHLPVHTYQQDGEWKMTPCAEVWMTEPQVRALIDLGLMPLVSFRDQDRVRLAGVHAIDGSPLRLAS
jgi:type VI secretion system protein ImpC